MGLGALLLATRSAAAGITSAIEHVTSSLAYPRVPYPLVPGVPQDSEVAYKDLTQDLEREPAWVSWMQEAEGVVS